MTSLSPIMRENNTFYLSEKSSHFPYKSQKGCNSIKLLGDKKCRKYLSAIMFKSLEIIIKERS